MPKPLRRWRRRPAAAPLRVYIRAGLKTHALGQHDYPQFLADWSKILTERGARVDGSLHAPLPQELDGVDVIVMYKGDAGEMTPEERAALEAFVKRGGGIVTFHDVLCGPDPAWFSTILGAAKKHGEVNYSAGPIAYTVTDSAHPIMQGVTNFEIDDEAFFKLTVAPGLHRWRRRRCRRTSRKSCRRSGHTSAPSPAASPIASSPGCRDISTKTSRIRSCSR